jgi:hypothetical protein
MQIHTVKKDERSRKMLLTQNFVEFTRKKVMKVRRRGGFSLSLYLELLSIVTLLKAKDVVCVWHGILWRREKIKAKKVNLKLDVH